MIFSIGLLFFVRNEPERASITSNTRGRPCKSGGTGSSFHPGLFRALESLAAARVGGGGDPKFAAPEALGLDVDHLTDYLIPINVG
jgi:hypothetical protein